jgi:AraC-like DNA-binding protein
LKVNATEYVRSYIEAWNRQDAHAVADHLAENGTYMDIPVHENMSREQLIVHLDELFSRETYRYELTGEVLAGGNTIAFQYQILSRQSSNSGPSEISHGAEFITLQDGVALEITDYYEQIDEHVEDLSPSGVLATSTRGARVQRYAKSGLSNQQMYQVKQQLGELMAAQKIYLRHELTLPELAEILGCSVNHVSQAINAGFGVSFFDYLNEYRVKDAMQLLGDESGEPRTVLSVALEVGFNSTSTFYVAFKKVAGQTPAEFRKSHSQAIDGP